MPNRTPVRTEPDAHRRLIARGAAQRVHPGQASKSRAKRTCCDEGFRIDRLPIREQTALEEPALELIRTRDVVARPFGDLGVDEVLDEIERSRRRRSATRLKGVVHGCTVAA